MGALLLAIRLTLALGSATPVCAHQAKDYDDAVAYYAAAEEQLGKDFPAEALKSLKKLAKRHPWFAPAHWRAATIEEQRNGWLPAYIHYIQYIDTAGPGADARLTPVLEALEQKVPALALFGEARRSADVMFALARAQSSAELRPNFPLPHRLMGKLRAERGDHARAVGHYRTYLELEPDAPDAAAIATAIAELERR